MTRSSCSVHARARPNEEAIAVSGGQYLLPRVMMARALLSAKRDRAELRRTLEAVLDVTRDAFPRARLANEIARRRAARYLDEAAQPSPAPAPASEE